MSDLVGYPKDRFSHDSAYIKVDRCHQTQGLKGVNLPIKNETAKLRLINFEIGFELNCWALFISKIIKF